MKKNKQSAPASAASSSSTSAASRRGQKTLGWFLSEELIEKTASNSSPSPPVQPRASSVSTNHSASPASIMAGAGSVSADEKKRRRGGRGHRQRKLTESLSTASEASLPMLETDEKDQAPAAPNSDFYVYDVASDGYYYEQNGAKGWRRRLPQGVQPKKPTIAAAPTVAAPVQQQQHTPQQTEELVRQAELAASAMQRSHMNVLQAAAQLAAPAAYNRYYDAPSDGYYFEMASVDGWRKRTAAPSAGAPAAFGRVPAARGASPAAGGASGYYNGGVPLQFLPQYTALQQQQAAAAAAAQQPSQSYGAALARGELPAKCMIESSASSSVSDDLSYPSLSRPTSLDLNTMGAFSAAPGAVERKPETGAGDQPGLFQWNADKFIEELCGQFTSGTHLTAFTESFDVTTGGELATPATSMWNNHRRFSATTTSSTSGAMTGGEEEDQEEYALTKELENIWKTPTPVQN